MAGYCLYRLKKRQVSYDSGATWQDVSTPQYMKGDLIEADSNICGYAVYTRWVESGYTCDGYNKHALEFEQISNDNINWTSTGESRKGRLIEANSEDCGYVPPSYSGQYLTFVAQESGTFTFTPKNSNVISYSTDNGSTWTQSSSVSVNANDKVLWKDTMTPSASYPNQGVGIFSSSGRFTVEGNVMSLLYEDNFSGQTDLSGKNFAFNSLFSGCTTLTSAENMILPATTLSSNCYYQMFYGCTSLTTAPSLPATTLVNYCYQNMFYGCSSLTTAPELPATTLAVYCYDAMFGDCRSLTTAPSLPATTLANGCYGGMFAGCTSLTTAPSLPATTLARICYGDMFRGCTSLTTAPSLPATTLANYCYRYMFSGCTSLSSITCLATNISAIDCTTNWLYGVAANGTFTQAASMTPISWSRGNSGIPYSWTVVYYYN